MAIQRLDYLSLQHFPTDTDDLVNETPTDRSFSVYASTIDAEIPKKLKMVEFIKARSTESKIQVLDCGAGQGTALDTLLESYLQKGIQKVTGISLHTFRHVKRLLKKHEKRMDWYLGNALEILPKLPEKYDLITDIYGSYFYSENRVDLIKAFHRALKEGGRAYILISAHDNPVQNLVNLGNKSMKLEEHLQEDFPETFKFWAGKREVLVITKASRKCPSFNFEVAYAFYRAVPGFTSNSEAIKGNGWHPQKVILKRSYSSNQLKSVEYESAQSQTKKRAITLLP